MAKPHRTARTSEQVNTVRRAAVHGDPRRCTAGLGGQGPWCTAGLARTVSYGQEAITSVPVQLYQTVYGGIAVAGVRQVYGGCTAGGVRQGAVCRCRLRSVID